MRRYQLFVGVSRIGAVKSSRVASGPYYVNYNLKYRTRVQE